MPYQHIEKVSLRGSGYFTSNETIKAVRFSAAVARILVKFTTKETPIKSTLHLRGMAILLTELKQVVKVKSLKN